METNTQADGIYENLAAKNGIRFKEKFAWVDETAVETNVAIANVYAAIMNALQRCLGAIGEVRPTGSNRTLRLLFLALPEKVSAGEIGRELGISSGNVTYLIDGMEREGLVIRVSSPNDRRITFVELTPKGTEIAERHVLLVGEFMAQVTSDISQDEKLIFNQFLDRVRVTAETLYRQE